MNSKLTRDISRQLCQNAIDVAWLQWAALGAMTSRKRDQISTAIVDIESLLMISLVLRDHERRLDDVLGWWSTEGAMLLSVQRSRNIAARYSTAHARRLADFAQLAAKRDRRWAQLAKQDGAVALRPRTEKSHRGLSLETHGALMLRLRAGFGVGAKADLLCLLIGLRGQPTTITDAAAALSYTTEAVRVAAQEMALAGFIESVGTKNRTRYRVDLALWQELIFRSTERLRGISNSPEWRNWAAVFPVVAGLIELDQQSASGKWSAYVQLSRSRDLLELHRAGVESALGHGASKYFAATPDAAGAMRSLVADLGQWMRDSA